MQCECILKITFHLNTIYRSSNKFRPFDLNKSFAQFVNFLVLPVFLITRCYQLIYIDELKPKEVEKTLQVLLIENH